jgi:carbon-monoxide dehydrogenase medium subunit
LREERPGDSRLRYIMPKSLGPALELLRRNVGKARIIGGGTDLKLLIDDGVAQPQLLVDVSMIGSMARIRESGEGLFIGGAAPLTAIQRSAAVRRNAMALSEAAGSVGSVQIRNVGTIGGNLANASPAADTPPALIALGAEVMLRSASKKRCIPVESLFLGVKRTCLAGDEIITEVRVPRHPSSSGSAFLKFSRGLGPDLSLVNTAASLSLEKGALRRVRVALGAVAPTPVRALHFEAMVEGRRLDEIRWKEALDEAMEDVRPITDVRTTERHRRALCRVLLRGAVETAVSRAGS